MKKIVVGITGASGSVYGKRLIEVLAEKGFKLSVIATDKDNSQLKTCFPLSVAITKFFVSAPESPVRSPQDAKHKHITTARMIAKNFFIIINLQK